MDNNFALFIDDLRKSRNISKVDFVDGIVSERQYYRFINGESSFKSDILIKFFNKLEVNSFHMMKLYNNTYKENEAITVAYELLYQNKYKESYDKIIKINYDEIGNEYDKKTYDLVRIISSYNLNIITKKQSLEQTMSLIDYPEVLKKTTWNIIESNALNFISSKLIEQGDYRVANCTYEKIKNLDKNTPPSLQEILLFYTNAKNLGSIKEYDKACNVAIMGAEQYIETSAINVLEGLLYIQALTEFYLNKSSYKKTLTRLFCQLYAEQNMSRYEEYKVIVEKRFNLKVSNLLKIM